MIYRRKNPYRRNANSDRNYSDIQYKQWRKEVTERDGGCCQWPGCTKTKKLNVHHIRKWSEFATLRYDVNNGILLCRAHHKETFHREEDFVILFNTIVARNRILHGASKDKKAVLTEIQKIRAEIRNDQRRISKTDRPKRDR